MSQSNYTPDEEEFIDTYVSAMSGGCTPIEDPERKPRPVGNRQSESGRLGRGL